MRRRKGLLRRALPYVAGVALILGPYNCIEYAGWRKSIRDSAREAPNSTKFAFGRSYSHHKSDPLIIRIIRFGKGLGLKHGLKELEAEKSAERE